MKNYPLIPLKDALFLIGVFAKSNKAIAGETNRLQGLLSEE